MTNDPKIVMMPWKDIKPYDKNPRKNDDAVDAVANSIREFGFRQPIVVDRDHVIIAGHTRWKASARLKLKEVPVIIAEDLTDDQVRAYRIADNSTAALAEWDLDLLDTELLDIGYDMSDFGLDFVQIGESSDPGDTEEVDVPDVPEETFVKRGQIYELGDHRLMCGDSTDSDDVDRLVGGEEMDLVVTDPPYNVNYGQKNEDLNRIDKGARNKEFIANDDLDPDSFMDFLSKAYQNMDRVLKKGGAFYIWYASTSSKPFFNAFDGTDLEHHQELVWVKNGICLSRSDYQWRHEPCIYGWKKGAGHYFVDDRSQHTVIEENKPTVSDLHPTMKPVALIARLIGNSSNAGQCVFDPFGGSGSTLIAAEQLGRRAYLMELDPHYVQVIIERWQVLTGKKARLVGHGE